MSTPTPSIVDSKFAAEERTRIEAEAQKQKIEQLDILLRDAIWAGDISQIERCIQVLKADVNYNNQKLSYFEQEQLAADDPLKKPKNHYMCPLMRGDYTPLKYAIHLRRLEIVRVLIRLGAKTDNAADSFPPVKMAIYLRQLPILRELLINLTINLEQDKGPINCYASDGSTYGLQLFKALEYIGSRPYDGLDYLSLLLQYGADPNVVDSEGKPALISAVKLHSLGAVELLLQHGAIITFEALEQAIQDNQLLILKKMIEHDLACIYLLNNRHQTLLHILLENDDRPVSENHSTDENEANRLNMFNYIVLKNPFIVHISTNDKNETPYKVAVKNGKPELAKRINEVEITTTSKWSEVCKTVDRWRIRSEEIVAKEGYPIQVRKIPETTIISEISESKYSAEEKAMHLMALISKIPKLNNSLQGMEDYLYQTFGPSSADLFNFRLIIKLTNGINKRFTNKNRSILHSILSLYASYSTQIPESFIDALLDENPEYEVNVRDHEFRSIAMYAFEYYPNIFRRFLREGKVNLRYLTLSRISGGRPAKFTLLDWVTNWSITPSAIHLSSEDASKIQQSQSYLLNYLQERMDGVIFVIQNSLCSLPVPIPQDLIWDNNTMMWFFVNEVFGNIATTEKGQEFFSAQFHNTLAFFEFLKIKTVRTNRNNQNTDPRMALGTVPFSSDDTKGARERSTVVAAIPDYSERKTRLEKYGYRANANANSNTDSNANANANAQATLMAPFMPLSAFRLTQQRDYGDSATATSTAMADKPDKPASKALPLRKL